MKSIWDRLDRRERVYMYMRVQKRMHVFMIRVYVTEILEGNLRYNLLGPRESEIASAKNKGLK